MDGGSTQSHALHLVLGLVFGGGTDNLFRDLVFLSYMEVRVDGMDLGKQVWRKVERCSLLLRATAGQSSQARHAATRGTKIRVQRLSPWVSTGLEGRQPCRAAFSRKPSSGGDFGGGKGPGDVE